MHDIHHVVEARKQEATQKKGAPMEGKSTNNPKKNPDPITGKPGAHPVGTGAGAAGGGLARSAICGAVGGRWALRSARLLAEWLAPSAGGESRKQSIRHKR